MKKRVEEFGKDLGLVHGVVCAGREIGADRDFWAYLAYDQKTFGQVVQIVKDARAKWLNLSDDEIEIIQRLLAKLEDSDCPYPEGETYYTRSSHSEYDERYHGLHFGELREVFKKASQSKEVASLCGLIEASFVLSYLLSGYYSAEQDPERKKRYWMHGPFSITVYFHDIWANDPRVPFGDFFSLRELQALPGLEDLYKQTIGDDGKACVGDLVKCFRILKAEILNQTKQELAKFVRK